MTGHYSEAPSAVSAPASVYIMPRFPRSDLISEMDSTAAETFSVLRGGMEEPDAFRSSVIWGENFFLSNGMPFSASARLILRTTASRAGERLIPAHHRLS